MASQKLTNRSIAVKPPKAGTLELWDTVVPGLALRVGYGGKRSYCVTTRIDRRQIRRTIGTTVTHTLAEAREAARDVIRDAAQGIDSRSRVAVERATQEAGRAAAETFRAVAEAWLADDGKKGAANLKSRGQIESRLRRFVYPSIGSLPLEVLTKKELRRVVDAVARKHPTTANRVFADIRGAYRFAIYKDLVDHSPLAGMEKPADENSRERVLSKSEIAALWPAFNDLGHPFGPFFKLLLFTGARRNEIAALTWDELDLDENMWRLPGGRTKNGKPHLVPLSSVVRAIIDDLPRLDGCPYVFTTNGRTCISGFDRVKKRLDRETGVMGWVVHDLRRTVVTGMAEMDIDPHVIEAVVNHTTNRSGVAGTYNRASYLPQRTAALEAWAQHVLTVVSGKGKGNVVDLRKAQ